MGNTVTNSAYEDVTIKVLQADDDLGSSEEWPKAPAKLPMAIG